MPFEWVASCFAPHAPHERAAHIKVGDSVRVVHGPERHQRGQVFARQEHGALLSLTDMQSGQMVSRNLFNFNLSLFMLVFSFLWNRTM